MMECEGFEEVDDKKRWRMECEWGRGSNECKEVPSSEGLGTDKLKSARLGNGKGLCA